MSQLRIKFFLVMGLFLILQFTSCGEDPKKSNKDTGWKAAGLKGKVKEYTESRYYIKEKFGEYVIEDVKMLLTCKFDNSGNLIQENEYVAAETKRVYVYNTNNKIQKMEEFRYGSIDYRLVYKYDDIDNLVESIRYDNLGEEVNKKIFKYDEKNRLSEEIGGNQSIKKRYIFKYDENDKLIEKDYYWAEYKSNDKAEYGFIEEYIGTFLYKYNEKGIMKSEEYKSKDKNEILPLTECKFDENGNILEKISYGDYSDFKIDSYLLFKYDEKNNLIEEIENRYKGQKGDITENTEYTKYTYKYDNKGNVIEKKRYNINTKENSEIPRLAYTYQYKYY